MCFPEVVCRGRKDPLQISGFWGLFWVLLGEHNHGGDLSSLFLKGSPWKRLCFFFLLFFYHLGQEAVWFDIGSNFIFKQNMRNTGEETALCSLKLVAEKTGLQKYSLMHTLDEHVPWLTQGWGALDVQQDCTFSSKGFILFFFNKDSAPGLTMSCSPSLCAKCQQLTLGFDSALPFGKGSWNQTHLSLPVGGRW